MSGRVEFGIYGASGTAGRLLVAELARRGARMVLAGRNLAGLEEVAPSLAPESELANAPLTDVAALLRVAGKVRVLIHCAGPFHATWQPLASAALQQRTHLVALNCELGVMARMFSQHAAAADADVVMVPSGGFSTVVGELAAWLAARGLPHLQQLTLAVAHAPAVPSAGTLRSYLSESTTAGMTFRDGGWQQEAVGAVHAEIAFPQPFGSLHASSAPLPEILTVPRALGLKDMTALLAVPGPTEHAAPAFMREPALLEEMLALRQARGTRGPTEQERSGMPFALWVDARDPDQRNPRVLGMTGQDPYGLTAVCAAWLAEALLHTTARGVIPAMLAADPQTGLARLAQHGVRWRTISA